MSSTALDASVIIPTYNRRDALSSTLTALYANDYPSGRWEILVVDDGSTDGTAEVVARWTENSLPPMRYIRQSNAGPAAARNRGARLARGRRLIFIDNDILVDPHFVGRHLEVALADPEAWVIGRVTHPAELRRTPFGRYRDAQWESFHRDHPSLPPGASGLGETTGMTSANLSLPAEAFHRLGGFDGSFRVAGCEDWELAFRARQTGIRVLYDPRSLVLHNDWAVTLERYCERQRLYAVTNVVLWRKLGATCPWARLVEENGPIRSSDHPSLILTKVVKAILGAPPIHWILLTVARASEGIAPDTAFTRRLYELAIMGAIHRGAHDALRDTETRSATG